MLEIKGSDKPLIAVHRGKSGANIIENTVASALCAIKSGANIVEFDLERTLDGKIVVSHSFTQLARYHNPLIFIPLTPYCLLKRKQFKSAYGGKSGYCINTLEQYLSALKGKCILNLDRIWCVNAKKALELIKKVDMMEQIIIKCNVDRKMPKLLRILSGYPNLCFMAICKNPQQFYLAEQLCNKHNVKLSGVEVLFYNENDYFCSDEFFTYTKSKGIFTWANAINLHGKHDICAGHGDSISIMDSPQKGWCWLIDKGYDVIQTDWPELLSKHL